jgi:hypothetical protein
VNEHRAIVLRNRDGYLAFEVEVILTAYDNRAS